MVDRASLLHEEMSQSASERRIDMQILLPDIVSGLGEVASIIWW
jgi:hypothetical protein